MSEPMNDIELHNWYRGRAYIEALGRLELWQPLERREMVLARAWGVRVYNTRYVAPAGMETDGASIPRWWWRVLDPPMFSRLFVGAVIHDAAYGGILRCYDDERDWLPVERDEADQLLEMLGRWNGFPAWKARLAYLAVHWFGRGPWARGHAANAGVNLRTLDYSLKTAGPGPSLN